MGAARKAIGVGVGVVTTIGFAAATYATALLHGHRLDALRALPGYAPDSGATFLLFYCIWPSLVALAVIAFACTKWLRTARFGVVVLAYLVPPLIIGLIAEKAGLPQGVTRRWLSPLFELMNALLVVCGFFACCALTARMAGLRAGNGGRRRVRIAAPTS